MPSYWYPARFRQGFQQSPPVIVGKVGVCSCGNPIFQIMPVFVATRSGDGRLAFGQRIIQSGRIKNMVELLGAPLGAREA